MLMHFILERIKLNSIQKKQERKPKEKKEEQQGGREIKAVGKSKHI